MTKNRLKTPSEYEMKVLTVEQLIEDMIPYYEYLKPDKNRGRTAKRVLDLFEEYQKKGYETVTLEELTEAARKQPMQLYEKLDYLKIIRTNYNDLLYRLNNKEYLESRPKFNEVVSKAIETNPNAKVGMYTEEEKTEMLARLLNVTTEVFKQYKSKWEKIPIEDRLDWSNKIRAEGIGILEEVE